ncbi:hypothetical protein GPECTOR_2g943 [Gonium pectorale]|uniref:Uncharacterized protein n=1 Tax=Gonium pectorale TaxID=33097 RepID=A0A150H1T6_GONPE|nr:hypothetical protein GPECTOR_2g943 [Gonium pectorale]|eukprot:KXZ56061.1 hypothetical protein GPECTOR_2g943 [Gonium pectorale]
MASSTGLASLEGEIKDVDTSIKKVERQIVQVEEELNEPSLSEKEKDYLREKEDYLRKKEEQLREEKRQLREQLREEKLRAERLTGGASAWLASEDGVISCLKEVKEEMKEDLEKMKKDLETKMEGLMKPKIEVTASSCSSTKRKMIESLVVLPVQTIEWLSASVHVGRTIVVIKSSKTDYIFIPKAAWTKCQEDYGAKLVDGWKLQVERGATAEALLSMLPWIVGLYEAKVESVLSDGVLPVRAQALLEYLAVNDMQGWPTSDVIVLFGDLNRHYAIHAGRMDAGQPLRSIHVAGPALLTAVAEHAPATAEDINPESVTLGFIRALLNRRRTEEAGSCDGGAANSSEGGASGSGGSAANRRGGGAANSSRGGASGSGGGVVSSRQGEACDSERGSSGSGDAEAGGGSNDACNGAGAGSGGGEGSCSSGADSSDGGGGSFDGDEGLLEAARENAYAQACMSLLRLPEVYEPLGLKEPPTSFRPPSKEEYLARFRPY